MNIFAIGDLHLSFSVENKEMDKFGPAWINYEDRLKENWNKIVSPEDLVILPGDMSWAMDFSDALTDLNWIADLPGKKLLLRGNHDYWWTSLKKMGAALDGKFTILQNNAYIGEGFAVVGSRGWMCPDNPEFTAQDEKVFKRECLRIQMSIDDALKNAPQGTRLIGALHFPPCSASDGKGGFTDIFREAGVTDIIYGHLHGEKPQRSGPKGLIDGINYHLCSLDSLGAVPKLIARI